jgi:SAM-dependent methyltransferase
VGVTEAVPTGNTFDKYGGGNRVERWMTERFLRTFDELIDAADPATVVEVGAGEGEIAQRVRQRRPGTAVSVLDLPDDDLREEWAARGLHGSQGSVAALPFRSDAADLALAVEVLEHVDDPAAGLAELARVAREYVLVSVPLEPVWRIGNLARGRYVRDLGNTPGHIQHWSRGSFVREVGRHVDVVAVRSPVPWTMVLGRVRT